MFTVVSSSAGLENIAHIIQVALTPAFFLSGIAALLNVFANRLGRVADKVDKATKEMTIADPRLTAALAIQLKYLRRRSFALDIAVILGACAGVGTCFATLLLFVGALREEAIASLLYFAFAAGLVCAIGSLLAFLVEMLIASRGIRLESHQRDTTEQQVAP